MLKSLFEMADTPDECILDSSEIRAREGSQVSYAASRPMIFVKLHFSHPELSEHIRGEPKCVSSSSGQGMRTLQYGQFL